MENRRLDCDKEFERIWLRLNEGNQKFEKLGDTEKVQDIEIATMKTNMTHLINSMSRLTGAIWGMTGSIIIMLIGFIIWYIQKG